MEPLTVLFQHVINRFSHRCQQSQIVHQVFWHGMVCTYNRDAVFIAIPHGSLTNPHQHLNMNHIWLEFINYTLYFALRCQRNTEVLVEREGNRASAVNCIITIDLLIWVASLAWRNNDHLVATGCKPSCQGATKSSHSINSRPMQVRRNQYFHTWGYCTMHRPIAQNITAFYSGVWYSKVSGRLLHIGNTNTI